MKIDVAAVLGAVTREVKSVERAGNLAHVVVASRAFDSGVEDVWDAISSAQRIARWFLPLEGELRVGGRFQLVGNASGSILRCERPRHLATTWEFGGEVSWLDVQIEPMNEGGVARFILAHTASDDPARWEKFGPGAVGIGWDMTLMGLALHLSTGEAVRPEEAMAWMMSDEGKVFMRGSGDGWRDASIAAGTTSEQARAAAERTLAFYMGGLEQRSLRSRCAASSRTFGQKMQSLVSVKGDG